MGLPLPAEVLERKSWFSLQCQNGRKTFWNAHTETIWGESGCLRNTVAVFWGRGRNKTKSCIAKEKMMQELGMK